MTMRKNIAAVLVLWIGGLGASFAGTLATPPVVNIIPFTNEIRCYAANLSSSSREITITHVAADGSRTILPAFTVLPGGTVLKDFEADCADDAGATGCFGIVTSGQVLVRCEYSFKGPSANWAAGAHIVGPDLETLLYLHAQ